jgi:hypothetical protein
MKPSIFKATLATLVLTLTAASIVWACPFCSVETQTLTEETRGADAVVLAKLLKEAPPNANPSDPNSGMATFQVVEVLHGQELLKGAKEISVVFFGEPNHEQTFLVNGIGKEKVDWTTPLPLSSAAVPYVKQLPTVPATGADRLAFFQEYLEHADPLLAQDSYDEFARAPYSEVRDLKPRMKHDRIVKWITDPEVSPSRRRLYLTMLGICGSQADVPMLETMIASDFESLKPALEQQCRTALTLGGPIGLPIWIDAVQQEERRKKLGLDALVACYLILKGPEGLDLVESRFLKNPHAEYTHIYSTIMALRFHGDENTGVLPRERMLASMRLLLENPDFADQVILDLSRWEDWSVLDRLVTMFKTSDEKGYVRQPVVSYLTVASEQKGEVGDKAKAAIAELEALDPETVKTARSLMAFGALGRARGVAASTADAAKKPDAAKDGGLTGVSTTDAKQGFAASAKDDKTDPAQIPDPAAYGDGSDNNAEAEPKAADAAPAEKPKTATTVAKVPVSSATSPAANAPAPAVPKTLIAGRMNPLVVAGVPIAAAALLMGIYWLILRAGAV